MKVFSLDSKDECSKIGANIILDELEKNKNLVLGLATGSTPELMYNYIIDNFKKRNLSFKDVKTFNLDEYVGLKPNYEDQSYRNFMNTCLFNQIDIDKNNTHFPVSYKEINVQNNYDSYDKLIDENGGIDIQILGIGNNGHIAFNEPGSELESKTRLIELTESTIKANSRFFDNINDVPKKAVTMGINSIFNAKKIILLAFGENKREAVEKLINAKSFDKNWPCTSLYNHEDLTILTDIQF